MFLKNKNEGRTSFFFHQAPVNGPKLKRIEGGGGKNEKAIRCSPEMKKKTSNGGCPYPTVEIEWKQNKRQVRPQTRHLFFFLFLHLPTALCKSKMFLLSNKFASRGRNNNKVSSIQNIFDFFLLFYLYDDLVKRKKENDFLLVDG